MRSDIASVRLRRKYPKRIIPLVWLRFGRCTPQILEGFMPVPARVDLTHLSATHGGSRKLTGHLVRPEGTGPWPGVVVVHEVWGVDDVMLRQTERLARAGYLTLMPDLYSDGGTLRCLIPTIRAFMSGRGRAFQDVEAARSALADHADCTGTVGVIGFCVGGSFALLAAGRGSFDAAAINYGPLPKGELDRALAQACPMVGSYGGRDRTLRGSAARLEGALDQLGVIHDVKEYPGAGHSFLNDTENGPRSLRPLLRVANVGPHPESSADAWQRIEEFFATHLR